MGWLFSGGSGGSFDASGLVTVEQLNTRQPISANLSSIAALTAGSAGQFLRVGADGVPTPTDGVPVTGVSAADQRAATNILGFYNPATVIGALAPITLTPVAGDVQISGLAGVNFTVVAAQNLTILAPTGLLPGLRYRLRVVGGGGGAYSVAIAAAVRQVGFPASITTGPAKAIFIDFWNFGTLAAPEIEAEYAGGSLAGSPAFVAGTASSVDTSPSFSTYLPDDLILAVATHNNTTGGEVISLPAGWTQIHRRDSINFQSCVVAWRRAATAGADTLGEWTGASFVQYSSWRNINWAAPIGATAGAASTLASEVPVVYAALTLAGTNSIVFAFATARNTAAGAGPPAVPGLNVIRHELTSTPRRFAGFSAPRLTSWPAFTADMVTGAASSHYWTFAVELRGAE